MRFLNTNFYGQCMLWPISQNDKELMLLVKLPSVVVSSIIVCYFSRVFHYYLVKITLFLNFHIILVFGGKGA